MSVALRTVPVMTAVRPSTTWRQQIAAESREVAHGRLAPANALLGSRYPEDLLRETDEALATFEADLPRLTDPNAPPAEAEQADPNKELTTALTQAFHTLAAINTRHDDAAYGPIEREQLHRYLEAVLQVHGVDPATLDTHWP